MRIIILQSNLQALTDLEGLTENICAHCPEPNQLDKTVHAA